MTWTEIGLSHLKAAKRTVDTEPRSSASRSYYAIHVVLAEALNAAGYKFAKLRQTQPHKDQKLLIDRYLHGFSQNDLRRLKTAVRQAYRRRLDADYDRRITFSKSMALDSLRDVVTVFRIFNVK